MTKTSQITEMYAALELIDDMLTIVSKNNPADFSVMKNLEKSMREAVSIYSMIVPNSKDLLDDYRRTVSDICWGWRLAVYNSEAKDD